MFKLIEDFKLLLRSGIVGLNQRNANYTLKYNARQFYPTVDNKLLTKRLAIENGIAVPQLLGVVEFQSQVKKLSAFLAKHNDFVIKPVRGSGGEGIVVITGRKGDQFVKASGETIDIEAIKYHVANILAGMYSLGNTPDIAIIEERIEFDPVFENVIFRGVPDIRIILLKGIPAMAMIRLPTRMSDGRANLHQGAIGAGINLATGRTMRAVCNNVIIEHHPDTGNEITQLEIPHWGALLHLAVKCAQMVKLGYIGVDIVLDRRYGPMILELNARPGLAIQIANCAPLGPRLNKIESIKNIDQLTLDERVNFAIENFK